MMKKLLLVMIFIVAIDVVSAATIHGNIYDISLDKVNGAVVEINTSPMQRIVAVNGSYNFEVPTGKYRILAFYNGRGQKMSAAENLTVVDDGDYVLDLFLYPGLDDEIFEDIEFDIENPYNNDFSWPVLIFFVFLTSVTGYIFIRSRKQQAEKEVKDDLSNIISLLKKNGGRMTQKELRKEFPLSEAKISLMLTELEDLGKIKKIKKGRGNVIILEK